MVCPHLRGNKQRKKYGRKWCGVQKDLKGDEGMIMKQEWCMTQDRHYKCPWYYEGNGDSYNAEKWFEYWQKRGK